MFASTKSPRSRCCSVRTQNGSCARSSASPPLRESRRERGCTRPCVEGRVEFGRDIPRRRMPFATLGGAARPCASCLASVSQAAKTRARRPSARTVPEMGMSQQAERRTARDRGRRVRPYSHGRPTSVLPARDLRIRHRGSRPRGAWHQHRRSAPACARILDAIGHAEHHCSDFVTLA